VSAAARQQHLLLGEAFDAHAKRLQASVLAGR
jgi:hypothetical protein